MEGLALGSTSLEDKKEGAEPPSCPPQADFSFPPCPCQRSASSQRWVQPALPSPPSPILAGPMASH